MALTPLLRARWNCSRVPPGGHAPMLQFFLASAPIFAVVALGFAAARLHLVGPQGFVAFAAYAFNLALPALMVGMLARQPLGRAFEPRFFAALLVAGLAIFVAVALLTAPLGQAGLAVAGSHAQAATGGNQAFLGVPLMLAVVGERATGPIAMVVLVEVGLLMPIGLACMGLGHRRAGASTHLAGVLAGPPCSTPSSSASPPARRSDCSGPACRPRSTGSSPSSVARQARWHSSPWEERWRASASVKAGGRCSGWWRSS